MALLGSLAWLLALAPAAWADPTAAGDAETVVANWIKRSPKPLGATLGTQVQRVETFKDDVSDPLYYVVYLNPQGFVIVPADDCVEPIVGFAPSGKYDPAETNPLGALASRDLKGRIKQVRSRVAEARRQGREFAAAGSLAAAQRKWASLKKATQSLEAGIAAVSDPRVDPLVLSKWDQEDVGGSPCYNYYTPGPHYVTGCIATATAQLLRYYQYPTIGVGTASFPIIVDFTPTTASLRGGDGAGGPYSWANMVLVPTASITTAQRQAIGALLYDVGVSVNMDYEDIIFGGSSANTLDAADSLVGTFKYSNAIRGFNADADIGASLISMINPNLDSGRPTLLGVHGAVGGHAVVCDGYGYNTATLYHHLNMGWSGTDDAWYNLPLIDPAPTMTFTTVTKCVYNVFKTGTGEIISGRATCGGYPVSGVTITATAGVTYSTTTNSRGIYALTVPSATAYTVTAAKAGYAFTPVLGMPVSTLTSTNNATTCGNLPGCDFTAPATLNLVVSGSMIHVPVKPIEGQRMTFSVHVTNIGNTPANNFRVGFWPNLSVAPTAGSAPLEAIVDSLPGGSTREVLFTTVASRRGTRTAWVFVDNRGAVAEDKSDNTASHTYAVKSGSGSGGGCTMAGGSASTSGLLGWILPYLALGAAYLGSRFRRRK